jgi:transposase
MADLAKKQLRKKIPALQLALEGCLLPHHRFLLADMLEELDHIGSKIARLEQAIRGTDAPLSESGRCLDDGSGCQATAGLEPCG